ncbi:MAG: hypothetical protein ACE5E7_09505 [Anaerolineae bacterium]
MADVFSDLRDEEQEDATPEMEDEFDELRRQSTRIATAFDDDLDMGMDEPGGLDGFSFSNFTPGQRLVLALLLVLDVVVIGIGVLIITGRIGG